MPKETIKSLKAENERLEAQMIGYSKKYEEQTRVAVAAEERADTLLEQFNDLKERLLASEMENQRLRGYIARVQEDDVVREELVTVGEPGAEQHMVPKRVPTVFSQPNQYNRARDEMNDIFHGRGEERRPPRHWVTYGRGR